MACDCDSNGGCVPLLMAIFLILIFNKLDDIIHLLKTIIQLMEVMPK